MMIMMMVMRAVMLIRSEGIMGSTENSTFYTGIDPKQDICDF